MQLRTFAIVAALSVGLTQTGNAYAPHKGAERPTVAAGRAPRLYRDVTWSAPHGALAALPSWRVIWDRDVDVPLRLWGPSLPAPSSDAASAEASARGFLAAHLALLAPGAQVSDFVVLANQTDPSGRIRTVSFAQHSAGIPVLGGAVAFTFSHDRLIMMSSTALPQVAARVPQRTLPAQTIAAAATSWLAQSNHAVAVKSLGARVIVPIVRSRGTASPDIEYRVAETAAVESTREPGQWDVWIDANDASPIARHSTILFASGRVLYNTPDRWPGGGRSAKPAGNATFTLGSSAAPATSLVDGTVTWADNNSVSVTTALIGPLVKVTNKAGALAVATLTLQPGGSVTWSLADDEFGDAQLNAFVSANTAKRFAKTQLNPNLAWLDGQIPVSVNETQTCNAYSTGNDIHFYRKNTQCENTGRLPDVVYHEFGHSVHNQSIVDGQGSFDNALSEGLADTLAASITGDHGMGRGFFYSNSPLRDLEGTKRWPDDATGEPHDDGEIIGETLWDLRTALQAKLGVNPGFARFLKLYYGVMQRAADIPSSYAEALVADDDDGDLANGTPNQCEINAAFGGHGLTDPSVTLGLAPPTRDGLTISLIVHPPADGPCPPPTVTSGALFWTPRGGNGSVVPLDVAGETWSGKIPEQPDGTVVLYHVTLTLSDGSAITFPQNRADPEYQLYAGNVTALWCADFEGGLGDWVTGGSPTQRVEWEAGMPLGIAGDPKAPHGGANVLGIDLGGDDGLYWPRTTQYVESPEIDLAGNTSVRLQYWRWLNVEDGIYDPATILINDQIKWQNRTSTGMPGSDEVNHTDKEWRFQDVDISDQTATGKVKIKFQIKSDEGLELAGWNVDDVCLVIAGPPSDSCEATGTCPSDDGGCCSAGGSPAGPLALSLLTLGLVVRRRRASRAGARA